MKKIAGILIILVALFLGSYYGMGVVTERTLRKSLDVINQSNGLSVSMDAYHRGWFKSEAQLNWNVNVPAQTVTQNGQTTTIPAKNFHANMPLTIYHGPIIYADSNVMFGFGYARTHLDLPTEYVPQFSAMYTPDSVKPSLNLGVFVNYMNRTFFHIDVPQFSVKTKVGNNKLDWSGLQADLRLSRKLNKVEGAVTIDGVTYEKDQFQVTLGKLTSDYSLHRTLNGLYLGEANLSLPSILVFNAKQKMFEMEAFEVHSQSDIHQGLFSSTLKLALDKMYTHERFYGPGLLSMSIKNLDAQVLADINTQLTKIQQGPDADKQRALLMLLPEVPKLLSKGAEFNISEASLKEPEGEVKGRLMIALPSGNLGNPFQLLQKIKGDGHVEISLNVLKRLIKLESMNRLRSQAALNQAATSQDEASAPAPQDQMNALTQVEMVQKATALTNQKLQSLIQSGAIVEKGDHFVIDLKLSQGQLLVNEKPFNSEMMQF